MKKIYLVFSYTGSFPSKIIKLYTRKEFSHISVSLDKNLNQMYSFARIYPYIAFIGGFVHEKPNERAFKRFKKTCANIVSVDVSDKQYYHLKQIIKKFENNPKDYKYNMLGFFFIPFHLQIKRKNHFYCAEFVKYLLDEINYENELPNLVKPADFMKLNNLENIYYGLLRNYPR